MVINVETLSDILSLSNTENAQAVQIVQRLVANEAFINKLAAQIIILQQGGVIRSNNYGMTRTSATVKYKFWYAINSKTYTTDEYDTPAAAMESAIKGTYQSAGYLVIFYDEEGTQAASCATMGGSVFYALSGSTDQPTDWQTFNGSLINLDNSQYLWYKYNDLIGVIQINKKAGWQIDYAGNAEFNNAIIRGLITQGTNFYVVSRVTMLYKSSSDSYTITFSNKNSGLVVTRIATGRFAIRIPNRYAEIGVPRVITHYCSDLQGSDGSPVGSLAAIANNTFHPGGSNPQYQCTVCASSVFSEVDHSTLETTQYIALYFTDNNKDNFVDPVFVQFSLICL